MDSPQPKLIIGVLGMPDNENTRKLLDGLTAAISIDFVIHWQPSLKEQSMRFMRKLRFYGILPAMQRVCYALFRAKTARGKQDNGGKDYKEYFVSGHTSWKCRKILKEQKVDILILATDAIITHKILKIPRLAVLNAHPGWIPQFRGLGSNAYQLAKGKFPAVSVHKVDEGIDTGPLILREYVTAGAENGLSFIEEQIDLLRVRLLIEVVEMFQRGNVRYIDTFAEPSNMTLGMPMKYRNALDKQLQAGRLKLSPLT